jgi:hypothetical protein
MGKGQGFLPLLLEVQGFLLIVDGADGGPGFLPIDGGDPGFLLIVDGADGGPGFFLLMVESQVLLSFDGEAPGFSSIAVGGLGFSSYC